MVKISKWKMKPNKRITRSDGWTLQFICIMTSAYLCVPALSYSLACLNAPTDQIKTFMNITEMERTGVHFSDHQLDSRFGLLVAVVGIGAPVGCLTASGLGDFFGKKRGLLFSAFVANCGVLLMVLSETASAYEMLFVGRTVVGLSVGWSLTLAPAYVTEMCTPQMKGAVSMVNQLLQSFSFMVTQILGYQELLGNDRYWVYLIGLPVVLLTLQIVLLSFCPETPRFELLKRNNEAMARKTLQTIRGRLDVQKDFDSIHQEIQESSVSAQVSIQGLFIIPLLRRPLIVAIAMGLHQNWCGMAAVMFFSDSLFKAVGVASTSARYATSGTGLVFFFGNIIAIFLLPRFGRKSLFIMGTVGMGACSALVAFTNIYQDQLDDLKYVNVVVSLGIILFYSIGPICVYWVMLAEMFPHSARSAGIGVAIFCAFVGFFSQCYALPAMQVAFKSYTFFVFVVIDAVMAVFCIFLMPETKDKSFAEISKPWSTQAGLPHDNVVSSEISFNMDTHHYCPPKGKEKLPEDSEVARTLLNAKIN